MANLLSNTRVGGNIQYGFYTQAAAFDFSPTYWHYKTNIALSTYVMGMVEAIGYNYGSGNAIRCAWTFYSYAYLANPSTQTYYPGLSADGVYVSSDGYICLRATGASYFAGWTFNATTLAAGSGTQISFTAVSRNSTTGNYY